MFFKVYCGDEGKRYYNHFQKTLPPLKKCLYTPAHPLFKTPSNGNSHFSVTFNCKSYFGGKVRKKILRKIPTFIQFSCFSVHF